MLAARKPSSILEFGSHDSSWLAELDRCSAWAGLSGEGGGEGSARDGALAPRARPPCRRPGGRRPGCAQPDPARRRHPGPVPRRWICRGAELLQRAAAAGDRGRAGGLHGGGDAGGGGAVGRPLLHLRAGRGPVDRLAHRAVGGAHAVLGDSRWGAAGGPFHAGDGGPARDAADGPAVLRQDALGALAPDPTPPVRAPAPPPPGASGRRSCALLSQR